MSSMKQNNRTTSCTQNKLSQAGEGDSDLTGKCD